MEASEFRTQVRRLYAQSQALGELWREYGNCFAVRTRVQAEVLDAFALSDFAPVEGRRHGAAWRVELTDACRWAYVSPALNDWTLVYLSTIWCEHRPKPMVPQAGEPHAGERERCAVLSERFGEAHWYAYVNDGGCYDWTAWCLAEDGRVVRYYAYFQGDGSPFSIGGPHPVEDGFLLPSDPRWDRALRLYAGSNGSDAWIEAQQKAGIPPGTGQCDAAQVAAKAAVDPSRLAPDTVVHGRGGVALTSCGRRRRGSRAVTTACSRGLAGFGGRAADEQLQDSGGA